MGIFWNVRIMRMCRNSHTFVEDYGALRYLHSLIPCTKEEFV